MTKGLINRRDFLSSSSAMIGVSIAQFDQKAGTPGVDQTALLAEAVSWCKQNGKNLLLESGEYITRQSIDGTGNASGQGFRILGPGPQHCTILHSLTEDYPVLDMSGNGRGMVSGFAIQPLANSQATTALLIAKGKIGSTSGNTFNISDMVLEGGSQADHSAAVIFNSDLTRIFNSEIGGSGGGAGLSAGFGRKSSIESKFYSMSSLQDVTQIYVNETTLHGDAGPALEFTGGAAISLRNIYASLVGNGSPYIVKISSPDKRSGNAFWADVLRTENQSKSRDVGAVYFAARSTCGQIVGNLQTKPLPANAGSNRDGNEDGYAIGSDQGCPIDRYRIQINTYSRAFNVAGGISNSEISLESSSLGYINSHGSYGLRFLGSATPTQVFEQLGDAEGIEVSYKGQKATSRD